MKKNRLCIVDDDDIFQFITTSTLKKLNADLEIMTFHDGEKAFEYINQFAENQEKLPDIILLDINMPFMDGWAFMKEYIAVKPRLTKKIYIYMISSSVDKEDVKRARSIEEISDYIIKPVTAEQLSEILMKLDHFKK